MQHDLNPARRRPSIESSRRDNLWRRDLGAMAKGDDEDDSVEAGHERLSVRESYECEACLSKLPLVSTSQCAVLLFVLTKERRTREEIAPEPSCRRSTDAASVP